ncbi:MAG: hotdog fold domain-containing protein [Gemmatimonadota bacterium]
MPNSRSPAAKLRAQWARLSALPGGRALFSRMLGLMIPYTGSIHPQILELRPGYAKVQMRDRRAVRNHLHSVHAIALMNLGEVTTGLAMTFAMPDGARGIVTGLSMEYLKKARGLLTAECTAPAFDASVSGQHDFQANIVDTSGDVVARATAHWLVGPITPK